MCASPARCSGTLGVVCYSFLPLMSSLGVTHLLPEEHRRELKQVDGHLPPHRLQVASCALILEGLHQAQNSWVVITFSPYFVHILPLLFGRESFSWAACWIMFFSLDFGGHTRWTPCFLLPAPVGPLDPTVVSRFSQGCFTCFLLQPRPGWPSVGLIQAPPSFSFWASCWQFHCVCFSSFMLFGYV